MLPRLATAFALVLGLIVTAAERPAGAHADHNYGESHLGKVVLGLGRSGTPFAYTIDHEPRGFEPDLARALAEEMEVTLEIRWLPRGELAAALERGEVDMINAAALPGPPPDATDRVVTLRTGEHVVVRRDNPFAIHEAEDLSGTMVVATQDSPGAAFARELEAAITATGKAPMEVHTMPMAQYTPVAVRFTHAAAYFAPTAAVAVQQRDAETPMKAVPGLFRPTGELAFAFPIGNAELKRDLRMALAQLVVKGRYDRLRERYHIPRDCSPFR